MNAQPLTPLGYLTARCDGSTTFCVPDLAEKASGSKIEVVLVFESPGKDELNEKVPVVGETGVRALRFLQAQQPNANSLGKFVHVLHNNNDSRIAVMNVSRVPLQTSAFTPGAVPPLQSVGGKTGWDLIKQARAHWESHHSQSNDLNVTQLTIAVRDDFQNRISELKLRNHVAIIPWGAIARRFCDGLPGVFNGKVPHPSPANPHWNAWSKSIQAEAKAVQNLFAFATR